VVTLMVKVIFDSNFLFVPFQFRINVFEELETLLGKCEPVILSTTMEELQSLTQKRSTKIQSQAATALDLANRCKVVEVERVHGESYDDVIVRTSKEWRCAVATNDAKLRKRLRQVGVTTIFLRQRSHLQIEGSIPH